MSTLFTFSKRSVMPGRVRLPFRSALTSYAVTAGVLLTGCGTSLATRTTQAMDACIAARNPSFTSGQGVTALSKPLPDSLVTLAGKLAYQRALNSYTAIAEVAKDQVTLVCALELASYYRNGDVAVLIWKYTKHPDAAVAESAKKLLAETQDPLPGSFR